jgi:hypothetical protein
MNVDPLIQAALRHWGARAVPFSDQSHETPFAWPGWEQAWLRIPAKADTCSNSKRTLIPIDIGQLSERSDALGLVINKCPI